MMLTALLVVALGFPQQASLPIGEIQVAGTMRFSAADISKVSGLSVGQTATPADFEAATRRMVATGLFRRVGFSYNGPSGRWILTFDIEDFDWNVPVTFDNLIWFTDEEVTRAVRDAAPTFAGMVPPTTEVASLITTTLQKLLQSRSIPGRVEFLPEGTLSAMKGYVFRVVDPAPPVCSWTFAGASAISPRDLEAELTSAGKSYSRTFVTRTSKGTLVRLYQRLGHWRATVGDPAVTVNTAAGCPGVSIAISISEGPQYKWAGADWVGAVAIPTTELDKFLGMKTGAPASLVALEDGLRRLSTAYGAIGHLRQQATYSHKLDDPAGTARFAINVVEGPQFRMGSLEIAGMADADAATLTRRWRLKPGAVFDASYPAKFVSEEIIPRLPPSARRPTIQVRTDQQQQLAHVRIAFGQ